MNLNLKHSVLIAGLILLFFCYACGKSKVDPKNEEPEKPKEETPKKEDPLARFKLSTTADFVLAQHQDVVMNTQATAGLERLKTDLSTLKNVLPVSIWSKLRMDTIWIEKEIVSIRYLKNEGNGSTKGTIRIGDLGKYLDETGKNQPALLLNYLSQMYFDKYMNSSLKDQINQHYASVKDSKYQRVYRSNGTKLVKDQTPDAVKDAMTYFAESTEAYLSENDYYPFDYQDLERYDPDMLVLLQPLWGTRTFDPNPDGITLPPKELKQWLEMKESSLDLYYAKYLDYNGLPILSSRFVSDSALVQARYIIETMLKRIPESLEEMKKSRFRIGIIGAHENVTDMPENRMMSVWWPGTNWDERGRGYGATEWLPLMTCGEENIVKIPEYRERYPNESIMVHEFAHNVDYGLRKGRPGFEAELIETFEHARSNGLWAGTYSMTNDAEYFAEGAQAWFDTCNMYVNINGTNTKLKTREQLKNYDPKLYELLSKIFPEEKLRGYHFTFE